MNLRGIASGPILLWALLTSPPALAVPPGQVSWTAEAVCSYRAIGALHSDPRLRNRDHLAGRFCQPVALPHEYEAARDVIDVDPEAHAGFFYVNARTRHIDDRLDRVVAEGVTQVVVLGAGFDSRAYRFSAPYPQVRFFEVDLPETIAAKARAVKRLLGQLPANVRLAAIDFDKQSLHEVLSAAGYDPQQLSFFIIEGVVMYLSAAGNEATFTFIRDHAPAGSPVVFDYVWRRVVEGDFDGLYAVRAEARGVALAGEPFLTGWSPTEAAQFAERHGLVVIENLDTAELTRQYGTGSDGQPDGRLPDGYGILYLKHR